MSDAWLASCTVQLMLHTELRLTQATAVALRLRERFGAIDPQDAVISAFEKALLRANDLPPHYRTGVRGDSADAATERRRLN